MIRLDKYLTEMNKGSRSQIKEAARKGRILVNGVPEKKTERKIDPQTDEVCMDGETVVYRSLEYLMLYKPAGVISATEDGRHKTVIDLLGEETRRDLFPVGRLDIDTEGLLILTNDGDLAHRLLAPKKHVDKQYYARIEGKLSEDAALAAEQGMTLSDGTVLMPAQLSILSQNESGAEVVLTIREGKFHQVKRMIETLGGRVTYLKRLSMGGLVLDSELLPGQYRALTGQELELLQRPCPEPELLREKQAVIFDLDGTLVDSMWMWGEIDIEYLGRFGLSCPPNLQKEIEGMSFTETARYFREQFAIPDSEEQIKQDWIDMSIEKYRNQVPLKKGARRLLEYLKSRGIRAGIATSNGRDMVDAVLEALKLKPYFEVVTTACEVAYGKPAPDIYLKVAAELSVSPEHCLVFEDVPAGIQAGLAAGMEVCAVEDSFSAAMREEKKRLTPFFIEDFDELFLSVTEGVRGQQDKTSMQ